MRIFVMVDMEGISGICKRGHVSPGDPLYAEGRRYLVADVNACVEGCFAGGADSVVVRDAHGGACHFIWGDLDARAEYIQGDSGKHRMPDLQECDGLILLGYHAMAGTPEAVLEHTMSSRAWQNFWMNGRKTGEIGIDAGIAGDCAVPTIMVSGDDKACAEAEEFIPGVVTACVKYGFSVEGGRLLSPDAAHRLVVQAASEAVQKADRIAPFKVDAPVTMRLELVSRGRLPIRGDKPYVKILDGRTYEVTGDSVEQALGRLG